MTAEQRQTVSEHRARMAAECAARAAYWRAVARALRTKQQARG
jgi:hypothetical protein